MSDIALEKQLEKWEQQDFSYREEQALKRINPIIINTEVEKVPQGNWKNIMNAIIWGNSEGKSKYDL